MSAPSSITQTRDTRRPTALISAELKAFVDARTAGLLRGLVYEVGLMATNLKGAGFSDSEVMKLIEDLTDQIRAQLAAGRCG